VEIVGDWVMDGLRQGSIRCARTCGITTGSVARQRGSGVLDRPPRLLATSPRVDWATLMRRTHDVDVFRCPSCGGRTRVVEVVTDKDEAAELWRAIEAGNRPEPRIRAPSRAPPGQRELPWKRA
jgi:hypothetical protein